MNQKNTKILLHFLFIAFASNTYSSNTTTPFTNSYSESLTSHQDKNSTFSTSLQSGFQLPRDHSRLETYAVARWLTDSSKKNDSYLFGGLGLDYIPSITWLRLTSQIGYAQSFSKLIPSALEGRVGIITYNEFYLDSASLWKYETYSESFYVHRYKGLLNSTQSRFFYKIENSSPLEVGPLLNIALGWDSPHKYQSRFLEARLGPRLKWKLSEKFSLCGEGFFATGKNFQTQKNINDFRLLVWAYANF